MEKEKTKKRDYSTHPKFVPWPPNMLEQIKNGNPTPEDPILISTYFQLYVYHHFSDYREFLLECISALGTRSTKWEKLDLPPFVHELFDIVKKNGQEKS
jgi:hypothetical protein